MVERDTVSNLSHAEEGEVEVDVLESVKDNQEEDFIVELGSMQQNNREECPEIESQEYRTENVGNNFQPFQTSLAGLSASSMKKEMFFVPRSVKRKIDREVNSRESTSSELMVYIVRRRQKRK